MMGTKDQVSSSDTLSWWNVFWGRSTGRLNQYQLIVVGSGTSYRTSGKFWDDIMWEYVPTFETTKTKYNIKGDQIRNDPGDSA